MNIIQNKLLMKTGSGFVGDFLSINLDWPKHLPKAFQKLHIQISANYKMIWQKSFMSIKKHTNLKFKIFLSSK